MNLMVFSATKLDLYHSILRPETENYLFVLIKQPQQINADIHCVEEYFNTGLRARQ
jgi:hypothetical protein